MKSLRRWDPGDSTGSAPNTRPATLHLSSQKRNSQKGTVSQHYWFYSLQSAECPLYEHFKLV